jgi:hypothetical protein
MAKVNNIASQITVRIDLPDNNNGSGVIIGKQGNTYYVLTADHIVKDEAKYSVVTPEKRDIRLILAELNTCQGWTWRYYNLPATELTKWQLWEI